jgi:hypothetical protein
MKEGIDLFSSKQMDAAFRGFKTKGFEVSCDTCMHDQYCSRVGKQPLEGRDTMDCTFKDEQDYREAGDFLRGDIYGHEK